MTPARDPNQWLLEAIWTLEALWMLGWPWGGHGALWGFDAHETSSDPKQGLILAVFIYSCRAYRLRRNPDVTRRSTRPWRQHWPHALAVSGSPLRSAVDLPLTRRAIGVRDGNQERLLG